MKAAIQGACGRLPNANAWKLSVQRRIAKTLVLSEETFHDRLAQARRHVLNLASVRNLKPFSVLELGTGRFPIIPIYLYLRGAARVVSIDIVRLLRDDNTRDTLRRFAGLLATGGLPEAVPDRAGHLRRLSHQAQKFSSQEILTGMQIETILGGVHSAQLPYNFFDLIVSNNTLEHIPADALADIFRELGRLAKSTAVMSHFIDMHDHYADRDPSITVYNYLRFSSRAWRWFNNPILYQNRLRLSDYRMLHRDSGWQVFDEENNVGPLEELRSITLASEFERYSEQDLAVCGSWMISQPAESADASAQVAGSTA